MKKSFLLFIIVGFIISCSSEKPGKGLLNEKIPYKEAKNYFVKNNFEGALDNPQFDSQQDFDKVFGTATIMGENGKPAPIDFSKEFAVAQIEDPSSQSVELKPVSVSKNANILEIKYRKIIRDINPTYKSQPVMILIIDRKYEGDVNLVEVE